MTNLDTLRALVELGEKATQGEWYGRHFGVSSRIPSPGKFGTPICDLNPNTHNADFILAAANARDALAALIAEFEKAVGLLGEAKPAVNATIKSKLVSYPGLTPLVPKDLYDRIATFLAANKQESA